MALTVRIAVLGWGSLLWDSRPEFDTWINGWVEDGPELRIEFSRISQSRSGALTLVLDQENGSRCRTAFAMSRRNSLGECIEDLRRREGSSAANIGVYAPNPRECRSRSSVVLNEVEKWAAEKQIDAVVWTDLEGNFESRSGARFSVEAAMKHLKGLPKAAKASAFEYIRRAPALVDTPLRVAIQKAEWFLAGHG